MQAPVVLPQQCAVPVTVATQDPWRCASCRDGAHGSSTHACVIVDVAVHGAQAELNACHLDNVGTESQPGKITAIYAPGATVRRH